MTTDVNVEAIESQMNDALTRQDIIAFPEVSIAPDFVNGVLNASQSSGIAGLHSNTLMFGWPQDPQKLLTLLRIMRAISKVNKNTIIASLSPDLRSSQLKKRIDLWWGGLQNNGDLMLLFSYLLTLNPRWEKAEIVLHSIVNSEKKKDEIGRNLNSLMPSLRLKAKTRVIVREPGQSVEDIIKSRSGQSDMVVLGLMVPRPGNEEQYADRLISLNRGLKSVIFVRNASPFQGSLI
jgi:hypothetical protein